MGGCCGTRANFSKTVDPQQMEEIIAEERVKYDEKLKYYIEKALRDAVEAGMKGENQEIALKNIQENTIKPGEIIKTFLDGVTEVQNNLKSKNYREYMELGEILEDYFSHANDKEDTQIKLIKAKIHTWFEKH